MWFSFWRSKNPFTLDELRYLTDQLHKVSTVSEANKDIVIETLRSLAELVTYGDQHDPAFFEFFMEKQVMADLVRILKISKFPNVAIQLLQTMSIMIQNLKSDHAIYYIFSNEHINNLITYDFDFLNEELLSYYISFLRAISGKLNKSTISLLVKSQHDKVTSFPLYSGAIRFAFHEENMVRIAVRALTLNVFHVGDEYVNRYITSTPLADYFSDLILFSRKQCFNLDEMVSGTKSSKPFDPSGIHAAVDEIEDTLHYLSDAISSGVPTLGSVITDNILKLLIFPLILPCLKYGFYSEGHISPTVSLYLLCCILQIVKMRDLASTVTAALFCTAEVFTSISELSHCGSDSGLSLDHQKVNPHPTKDEAPNLQDQQQNSLSSHPPSRPLVSQPNHGGQHLTLRDVILSYITSGDDVKVLGSLSVLATLLQTKELPESMLDALGILPERMQQKKLLLQALVGEDLGEEQLFSSTKSFPKEYTSNELEWYLNKLKDQYGMPFFYGEVIRSPCTHKYQVVEALINLFCRSGISAETLWEGGWLLRQLLPCSGGVLSAHQFKLLRDSYKCCITDLFQDIRGSWCDLILPIVTDEWKKCKRACEAVTPKKDLKHILLLSSTSSVEGESSIAAGERMYETIKVFVLRHQLCSFAAGECVLDQPSVGSPIDLPPSARAKNAFLDTSVPKPGTEVNLAHAVPCRIAFEKGKERHFYFLAVARGLSGWILLAEELPLQHQYGVVRVAAPLAGSNPRIDDKHQKWLHLRIRPPTLKFLDDKKSYVPGTSSTRTFVDGRWTLAFKDEQTSKFAECMILEEMQMQSNEVHRRLKPLLEVDFSRDLS